MLCLYMIKIESSNFLYKKVPIVPWIGRRCFNLVLYLLYESQAPRKLNLLYFRNWVEFCYSVKSVETKAMNSTKRVSYVYLTPNPHRFNQSTDQEMWKVSNALKCFAFLISIDNSHNIDHSLSQSIKNRYSVFNPLD